jgi:hypothetical protein
VARPEPRLFADSEGVWRQDSGKPFGIRWEEIYRVTGYKLDCVTEVDTCLVPLQVLIMG